VILALLFLLYGFDGFFGRFFGGLFDRFFDDLKSPRHFVPHIRKISAEQRAFGIDDDVRRKLGRKAAEPHRLAKAALHAVALYGASQHAPHGKADAKTWRGIILTLVTANAIAVAPQIKNCHVRREMAASLFVNLFKIRMP